MASAHAEMDNIEDFKIPEDTAYYPIDDKTFSLASKMCKGNKELFIIGTEPEYDCEGNFHFYIPEKFLSFINQEIPDIHYRLNLDKKEKKVKIIIDENDNFIFDIKGEN